VTGETKKSKNTLANIKANTGPSVSLLRPNFAVSGGGRRINRYDVGVETRVAPDGLQMITECLPPVATLATTAALEMPRKMPVVMP